MLLLLWPVAVLQIGLYALWGLADVLRGRRRLRAESTVLIDAPRGAVWHFLTADRVMFDGAPLKEVIREPLPGSDDLYLTRTLIDGEEWSRVVSRELVRDEAAGTLVSQSVPDHPSTHPPELANDCVSGARIETRPQGTALTLHDELTVQSFRDRITCRVGVHGRAARIKRQCEKPTARRRQPAGPQRQPAGSARQAWGTSAVALLSFWYLFGWRDALLMAVIVILHEGGHAAAMRMVGIEVRGVYLVPFFGGAAVPKSAYKTQGHLGFVALMGPGFSLIPTFTLAAAFWVTGEASLLHAISLFALINAVNLLPIYPLDGGLIVNALLGSLSRRLSQVWGWIGVLTGLGIALYLQSYLIGIPFLVFALQHYLRGGRTLAMKRLSFAGAAGLVLAFAATFALHVLAFAYAEGTAALYYGAAGAQDVVGAIGP
jgi:Zn-dependent protease